MEGMGRERRERKGDEGERMGREEGKGNESVKPRARKVESTPAPQLGS